MEPAFIFYRELPTDEENIFSLNISGKNEVENVKISKSLEYGITGMTVKPDIGNSGLVKVKDERKLKLLSEKIQELDEKTKAPNLLFPTQQQQKNEDIEFYNYYEHLKNFGFEWENDNLEFKFSKKLSKDEKKKTDKKKS